MWKIVFMLLPLIPVMAWGLTVLAAVVPLRLGRRASLFVSFALALAFGKFAAFALFGGSWTSPDLPQWVIWAYSWAYGMAMLLGMFASVAAIGDGLLRVCRRPVSVRTKRIRTVALAVFAAAVAFWGIYEGVCIPSVRSIEISWRELPSEFDGYRIVHLSDLHCSTAARRSRFERIVERVNALDADLVAITGDFVDGRVQERSADLSPISGIRAKDGMVCCTGNHEVYSRWDAWRGVFLGWGFEFPEETGVRTIRRGGGALAIGGLIDPAFMGWGMDVKAAMKAESAFRGAPDNAFRILLFHRPLTAAIDAEAADVRLQLSGHTHGGAMPLVDRLVALSNEGRTRGLYEFAPGRFLYLSPGSGQWAGYPMRMFNPAEITEIILRKAPPAAR